MTGGKGKKLPDLPAGWFCEDQMDLLEFYDTEPQCPTCSSYTTCRCAEAEPDATPTRTPRET